jgi:hypothetical protein
MTKKDFQLIADVIKNLSDTADNVGAPISREALAKVFAAGLRSTNDRFDRERFIRACGVPD